MHALLSTRPGGHETLKIYEIADPIAGPGELLVAVSAALLEPPPQAVRVPTASASQATWDDALSRRTRFSV